jgi:hypothetical protein
VQRLADIVLGRRRTEAEVPTCHEHNVAMRLRGKQGRPTRFTAQTEEEYTLIYFCPVEGCNATEEVKRVKTQIPYADEVPERPLFSRRGDR